jgi:tetratricopeptide (TPR) repeat protein
MTMTKSVALRLLLAVLSIVLVGALLWSRFGADPYRGMSADRLVEEFDATLNSGRLDQADSLVAAFRRKTSSSDPRTAILAARLDLAKKHDADALAVLESVPDTSPFAAIARQMAGQVQLRAGKLVAAEENYKRALAADPKLVLPRRELIYIYGLQLRRFELRQAFAELAAVAPLSFQNVFHWCLTRGNDWEPQEIIDDMTRFLAADPNDRWSRIALARSLARLSKLDEAWKTLEPLAEEDPDALALRAQVALDLGDPDRAAELLSKGPREHFDLAVMRARSALAAGETQEAFDQFGVAVKLDPDNRDAVVGMARVLSALGRHDEAKPWQERAAKLDRLAALVQEAAKPNAPSDAELPRKLARGCEDVGHLAEAKAWWGLIAARDPLDQEAQSAMYRLNQAIPKAP